MKITFPHMGNLYICVKALLDDLNIDYIIPPFSSKKSLELGTRFAPECACLPLKITIGNFLEANEQGADTVLMAGGCGPCRFGYYCEMHREILADLDVNMNVIALEPPDGDIKELLKRIRELTGGFNVFKIFNAVKNATKIAIAVDELERLTFKIQPREIEKGSVNSIYKQFRENVVKTRSSREIKELIKNTREKLSHVKINDKANPLRIGIVGEIYTTIDDYTSFDIQQRLGRMGVEVDRYVTVSGWITEHIMKQALKLPRDLSYAKAAKPYLGTMIGGHAQE
ncbi:MAG TPA: CoA protein activase, partial [Clostridiales bacterium]|nr:CoA protein activase [Clostridiales bacterium]